MGAVEPHLLVEDLFGCAACPLPRAHPVHIVKTTTGAVPLAVEHPAHEVRLPDAEPPSLPYDGTSGHSGSETSRARAIERDTSGKTATIQNRMLACLTGAGFHGLTIAEARVAFPQDHHGSLSGALSVLHKEGRIARLRETREKCEIYVLPENVLGRETVAHGRRRTSRLTAEDHTLLVRASERAASLLPRSRSQQILEDLIALVRRLDGAPNTEGPQQ